MLIVILKKSTNFVGVEDLFTVPSNHVYFIKTDQHD